MKPRWCCSEFDAHLLKTGEHDVGTFFLITKHGGRFFMAKFEEGSETPSRCFVFNFAPGVDVT